MKATFQIPDELYREVKARTAREGPHRARRGHQPFSTMAEAEKSTLAARNSHRLAKLSATAFSSGSRQRERAQHGRDAEVRHRPME